LSNISYETGLSGTSRLHDLFIGIEGMPPGEVKNGGEGLNIYYSFAETLFGKIIIASAGKGICHLTFVKEQIVGIEKLKYFPHKSYIHSKNRFYTARCLHYHNEPELQ